ncbi:MAG: type II toxin-antitoxin system VapB family antitoxin [SAR202 cluster bacterium]|nr:type II toxin-antitoxin system VapB family antitoxin [SAR202 cluster bacterium]
MRTTIELDERLLAEVFKLTREKTKTKAVNKALEEFVRHERIQKLRSRLGSIDLGDGWYKLRHMEPR